MILEDTGCCKIKSKRSLLCWELCVDYDLLIIGGWSALCNARYRANNLGVDWFTFIGSFVCVCVTDVCLAGIELIISIPDIRLCPVCVSVFFQRAQ
jgi:hypothetical protein